MVAVVAARPRGLMAPASRLSSGFSCDHDIISSYSCESSNSCPGDKLFCNISSTWGYLELHYMTRQFRHFFERIIK